ncbi:unnamed protein product, partial [Gulo gulo]
MSSWAVGSVTPCFRSSVWIRRGGAETEKPQMSQTVHKMP